MESLEAKFEFYPAGQGKTWDWFVKCDDCLVARTVSLRGGCRAVCSKGLNCESAGLSGSSVATLTVTKDNPSKNESYDSLIKEAAGVVKDPKLSNCANSAQMKD